VLARSCREGECWAILRHAVECPGAGEAGDEAERGTGRAGNLDTANLAVANLGAQAESAGHRDVFGDRHSLRIWTSAAKGARPFSPHVRWAVRKSVAAEPASLTLQIHAVP